MTIAALLTCHNRKDKTMACLRSLSQAIPEADVFLTDDGSTDGTAEAVSKAFPRVQIIGGDGSLYWNRGMRKAWMAARQRDYDYYLWLNDDTVLYDGCLDELLACHRSVGELCIVSGLVEDESRTKTIYGGYDAHNQRLLANGDVQDVVRMNGNVVLVPHKVVERIGILDPYFIHDLGDVDYGLTAREQGIRVVTTRCNVAQGTANDACRIRQHGVSLRQRFRYLNSPLGAPLAQNFYFRRKHFGWLHALAYVSKLIFINLLPDSP